MRSLQNTRRIAHFSMEIALEPDVPTYSGGLGVLAGDTMRSAADLGVPLVGVTLASRAGYFRQHIVEGGLQEEEPQFWLPQLHARKLPVKVALAIGGREVWVAGWEYAVQPSVGDAGEPVPVLLLDTDLPENDPDDRILTHFLYGGDAGYRLRQEMVLGIGGVRMLEALSVSVQKYHLNEGHAAFLTLALLRERLARGEPLEPAIAAVQAQCVFTTHTPVPAGHDQFDLGLADAALAGLVAPEVLRALGGAERLNMTRLALALSGWVNGVAKRHAEVSSAMFAGREVHAITNGVHPWTWTSDAHRHLYDHYVPHWQREPERLAHARGIPAAALVEAHRQAKLALLAHAEALVSGQRLAPERFTIGFARRMTAYKRPWLLFSDLARLRRLALRFPLQVVLSGKAHPRDEEGKRQVAQLHAWAHELQDVLPVVFLPGYDMRSARLLAAGVDLWLNTPQRPLEASGTSGMKAALNGVPSLSVLDGWWLEGCMEGVTGWAIGADGPHDPHEDQASLYDRLERVVLPLWSERPAEWAEVMRGAIVHNGAFFHSHRMLRRYALEAYAV
jgi:starch phosphorylase